jgi:multidrug efflux pump subunit AcrB
MSMSGMDPLTFSFKTNAGLVWVPLKPWDERTGDPSKSPHAVVQAVMAAGSKVKDAFFFAVEPPPIEGLVERGWLRDVHPVARARNSQRARRRRAEIPRSGCAA